MLRRGLQVILWVGRAARAEPLGAHGRAHRDTPRPQPAAPGRGFSGTSCIAQARDDTRATTARSIEGFHPPFRLATHLPLPHYPVAYPNGGTVYVHASGARPYSMAAVASPWCWWLWAPSPRSPALAPRSCCTPSRSSGADLHHDMAPAPDPTWACCPDARVTPVGAGRTV